MSSSYVREDLRNNNYGSASNLAFNEHIKALIEQGQNVYHFGFGQSPFPVLEVATTALRKHATQNSYLPVNGIRELREGICEFHKCYDNLTFDPDDVVVGPGSKELILLLMTIFGGDVLLNSPSWTTYQPQAILAGRRPFILDTREEDQWRVTPRALDKVLQENELSHNKLLIFTNPCNPTGVSYTDSQLQNLTLTLRKHNILVLSDEIYARLHYHSTHVSLSKYYPEGTILCSGFSKWASAGGWRLGYNIFPKQLAELRKTVMSAASHSYSCAPAPAQFAFAEVLQDIPACDEYIKHTSRILKMVSMFCARELRSVGVKAIEPTAGYYIFPNFDVIRQPLAKMQVHTGKQMCELMLREANVAVLPGGPDHLRPADELTVRLCFVNFDGKPALEKSRRLGLDSTLDDAFFREFCAPVYEGIMALKNWVHSLLQDHCATEDVGTQQLN